MLDSFGLSRRSFFALAFAAAANGCKQKPQWRLVDVDNMYPKLEFQMTDARTGKAVSASDYLGKVVALFFGYTFCPEICPTTLLTLSSVMEQQKDLQDDIAVLFVSVDPDRDTPDALKQYLESFSSNITALTGTSNELAYLARRYRVAYTVNRGSASDNYTVDHTATVFVFDRSGRIRLLAPYGTSGDDFGHDLQILVS